MFAMCTNNSIEFTVSFSFKSSPCHIFSKQQKHKQTKSQG